MADEEDNYEDLLRKREELLKMLEEGGDDDDDDDSGSGGFSEEDETMEECEQNGNPGIDPESPERDSPESLELSSYSETLKRPADEHEEGPSNKQVKEDCEEDIDLDAIEELLERPVDKEHKDDKVWKTVLEDMDMDYFNQIPQGWTQITHHCGMPIYLHKSTRVVTFSRPHQLTTRSIRSHAIPMSSIPCLYRQKMEEMRAKKANNESEKLTSSSGLAAVLPKAPEAVIEKEEDYILTSDQMTEYCSKRFKFKKILVKTYNSVQDKHKARSDRKQEAVLHKLGIYSGVDDILKEDDVVIKAPTGGKLLNIPAIDGKFNRKSFIMNPMNKSSVNILGEYTMRAMRGKMDYLCEDSRNPQQPYKATAFLTVKKATIVQLASTVREKLEVLKEKAEFRGQQPSSSTSSSSMAMLNAAALAAGSVGDDEKKIPIGRGFGSSKRVAKLAAAKDALDYLIPSLRINSDFVVDTADVPRCKLDREARELMDQLKIESKSVAALCNQTNQTKPYALLKEVIKTSIRWSGFKLEEDKCMLVGQNSKVVFTLGEHSVEAEARGMKVARQIAAQKLLKLMHPELETYGSLLRLYANQEDKDIKEEAKKHHNEVVRLQGKGNLLLPNMAVINKLKDEMRKMPIIQPPRKILYHSFPEGPHQTC